MNKIKTILRTITTIWQQFYRDNCFNRAAGLAYTTLLSLVPLLAVGFSVLSAFPIYRNIAQKVQSLIFAHFVADSAQSVQQYFLAFIAETPKLSIIGTIGLVITAVLLVFSMEQTFNNIWRVERNRHGVTAFLLYWAVITLIPIAIASLFGIGSYLTELTETASARLLILENIFGIVLPYLSTFIVFALLYSALPNCQVPVRSSVIAAIVATILFELARHAFILYIHNFAGYALIYGALAAIPIFLVWLYISWVIILFGVVISYVLTTAKYPVRSV